jgi:HSP20 family protein
MKLIRTNPSNLARVSDFDEWFRHPFAGLPAFGNLFDAANFFGTQGPARLATDVYEDADNFYARFEIPGVKKEDVKLELHERLLTVSAEKREKSGDTEQSYSLTRSVSVPDSVAEDRISAKLEDGLLTVTLPKQEHRKPRTIGVQ